MHPNLLNDAAHMQSTQNCKTPVKVRQQQRAKRQQSFMASAEHERPAPIAISQAHIMAHEAPVRDDLQRDVQRVCLLVKQVLLSARFREHGMVADKTVELVFPCRLYAVPLSEEHRHVMFM
jgi:hypothetical protein